jgi:hypothetical protein
MDDYCASFSLAPLNCFLHRALVVQFEQNTCLTPETSLRKDLICEI